MGRVRTKTVKKYARIIVEKYYPKLTYDFKTNKALCKDVAVVQSARMRNQIAGYVTHLMNRIKKGPVRGISIKLQEEERQRRDNYIPEISEVDPASLGNKKFPVDLDTKEMLDYLGIEIPYVELDEKS